MSSGPGHADPGHQPTVEGILRPRRGRLLSGLFGVAGIVVLTAVLHAAGWGIVLTIALVATALFALVSLALSCWRARFDVRSHEVRYYPPIGRMRQLDTTQVAEVVHLHLRSPGSRAATWITLLADGDGRCLLALSTPLWPPADLEPVLSPFVAAGATPTVVDPPVTRSDLPPRYRAMLPWGRRNVGTVVALVVVAAMLLVVASGLVG